MKFLGLRCGAWDQGLQVAGLAFDGEREVIAGTWDMPYPGEIRELLHELQDAPAAGLAQLGALHIALGHQMSRALREGLASTGWDPIEVKAGCQGCRLAGGLVVGDLGLASTESGLPVFPAGQEAATAVDCARSVSTVWRIQATVFDAPDNALTEAINPLTADLDRLPTLEMLRRINAEDQSVPYAVARALPQIAEAVDQVSERMRKGGRLIFTGAGTSGRLGVLDASEIPPTYGMESERVVALIAGGDQAIRYSVEGAEDNVQAGAQALAELGVQSLDSVVGIAASGRTPYVLGALAEARRRGALTISMACNSPAPIEADAEIRIALLVGPEVITGSTRMKAGTAQKLALNLLSTGVMVRLGKTFGNWMVDLRATNQKLRARARRIVAQAAGLDEASAAVALDAADGEVKTAIVAALAGLSPEEARLRLARRGGAVRAALSLMDE